MWKAAALACLALCTAGSASGHAPRATSCAPTVAGELAASDAAGQLVTVVARRVTSTRGGLRLWRKSGECWLPAGGPWTAWLARRGLSERRREGDGTTPAGVFGFGRTMYGVAPNPGVHFRYRRVVCGDWWVEDPRSPYYNRLHHVPCGSRPPFRVTSEDLSRSPTAYRHFAFIRYNAGPIIPGRGSGIFLHASVGKPTHGCVSLPLPQLLRVLRWLRPAAAPLIAIGTREQLSRF